MAASPRTFVRRYPALLLASFGGTALVLALVGIYGVLAHDTARRTREIGVRMALGAQRADVLGLVLGRVAALASLGVGIGMAASVGVARALSALLFGVGPWDAMTSVGATLLMLLAALTAGFVPARRALATDPMTALRHE